MSRALFLLALPGLLLTAPAAFSGPPEVPSGRMVQDQVPALAAEVKRLEKQVARDKSLSEDLAVARARLAAAEGRKREARAAWRKVLADREEIVARWEALVVRGRDCTPIDPAIMRGPVAEARCELAEVDGDRAALARELPKVIAYREAQLVRVRRLAKVGAYPPEDAEQEEKVIQKELGQTRQRLDDLKRR
jgi:hypothetical protein